MPEAENTPAEPEVKPAESAAPEPKTPTPEATPDMGDAGKAAIQREREARKELERKLAEADKLKDDLAAKVKAFEDRDKSEQERMADEVAALKKQVAEKDAEITKARQASLRAEVAAAKGVPANRLHGSTKEELEADADAYLSEVAAREQSAQKRNPPKPPAANLKSGASSTDTNGLSGKAQAAQALRRLRAGA